MGCGRQRCHRHHLMRRSRGARFSAGPGPARQAHDLNIQPPREPVPAAQPFVQIRALRERLRLNFGRLPFGHRAHLFRRRSPITKRASAELPPTSHCGSQAGRRACALVCEGGRRLPQETFGGRLPLPPDISTLALRASPRHRCFEAHAPQRGEFHIVSISWPRNLLRGNTFRVSPISAFEEGPRPLALSSRGRRGQLLCWEALGGQLRGYLSEVARRFSGRSGRELRQILALHRRCIGVALCCAGIALAVCP